MPEQRRRQSEEQPELPHDIDIRNGYSGWNPSTSKRCTSLDRVPMAELTPQTFFHRFVAARRPVVLTGGLHGTQWERAGERWTDGFLAEAARGDEVRVEVRASSRTDDPYGGRARGRWRLGIPVCVTRTRDRVLAPACARPIQSSALVCLIFRLPSSRRRSLRDHAVRSVYGAILSRGRAMLPHRLPSRHGCAWPPAGGGVTGVAPPRTRY